MKKFVIILPLFVFLSCTVQKRHYQKGYFVSWNKKAIPSVENKSKGIQKKHVNDKHTQTEITLNNSGNQTDLYVSASKELPLSELKKLSQNKLTEDSCDVLIFKDGSEKRIKLVEISSTQVRYKKCDVPDGPLYVSNKSELFMIKYANGIKEVIKATEPTNNTANQNNNVKAKYTKKRTALATNALIFSILGFYPLVFIGGLVAIITGLIQLNNIATAPDAYGGERRARAGLIMGIISVVLWISFIALLILFG